MDWPAVYTIIADGYEVTPEDGSVLLRAESGKARMQRLYGSVQYTIRFRIAGLTSANVAAVRQFYGSYKTETITWTDPFEGVDYDALFLNPPRVIETYGQYCTMEVSMTGEAQ